MLSFTKAPSPCLQVRRLWAVIGNEPFPCFMVARFLLSCLEMARTLPCCYEVACSCSLLHKQCQRHINIEATYFNTPSDKESQIPNSPATYSNQFVTDRTCLRSITRFMFPLGEIWTPAFSVYAAVSQKGEYSHFHNEGTWKPDYDRCVDGIVA